MGGRLPPWQAGPAVTLSHPQRSWAGLLREKYFRPAAQIWRETAPLRTWPRCRRHALRAPAGPRGCCCAPPCRGSSSRTSAGSVTTQLRAISDLRGGEGYPQEAQAHSGLGLLSAQVFRQQGNLVTNARDAPTSADRLSLGPTSRRKAVLLHPFCCTLLLHCPRQAGRAAVAIHGQRAIALREGYGFGNSRTLSSSVRIPTPSACILRAEFVSTCLPPWHQCSEENMGSCCGSGSASAVCRT